MAEILLAEGTILKGMYTIESVISDKGGAGITYRAKNAFTGEVVAIKEFLPKNLCTRDIKNFVIPNSNAQDQQEFKEAKEMFGREAMLLKDHPHEGVILKFYDVFEANQTVYYVMEYLAGKTLAEDLLAKNEKMSLEDALKLLKPIFKSLIIMHEELHLLHRDISPANIFLCEDGAVRLIDFGTAHTMDNGMSQVRDWHKVGYSPLEQQMGHDKQGPWTDVYALAATLYRCITATNPLASESRFDVAAPEGKKDRLVGPIAQGASITPDQERVILKAMALHAADRYESVRQFYDAIYPTPFTEPVADKAAEPTPKNAVLDPVLLCLDGEHVGETFHLTKELTFGRSEDCDVVFARDALGVSRTHCKVWWNEKTKQCHVMDLGSTYGTRDLGGLLLPADWDAVIEEGHGFILGDNQTFAFSLEIKGE